MYLWLSQVMCKTNNEKNWSEQAFLKSLCCSKWSQWMCTFTTSVLTKCQSQLQQMTIFYFIFIFQRKQVFTFHVNCLLGRQFTWNVKTCFTFSRRHFDFFSSYFSEKTGFDKLHDISNNIFWENKNQERKIILQNVLCWIFYPAC